MQGLRFVDSYVKMPLVQLPVRTVVATVSSGTVMYSPGSQLTEAELRGPEPITDIVAPSLWHLGGIPQAVKAHPTARVWGPKGCREKRGDISWTHVLGLDPWPHAAELPVFEVGGVPRLNEVVLLHRPSRTLLVTDLFFNVRDASGLGARIIFGLFGTFRRFGVSKLYLKEVKDRAAFQASVKTIAAEAFDNVQPSHGDLLQGNARAQVVQAFQERGITL